MGARATGQISMIVVTLVATRFLGPADFGVFAIAAAFVTLSRTLLYAGAFEYLLKAPDLEATATECLTVNLLLALVNAVALCALAAVWQVLFNSHAVAVLMLMLVPSNFIAAVASWEESLMLREGKVRGYYLSTMLVEIFCGLLAVAMLWMGYGLIALVAQIYSRVLILAVIYRFTATMPILRRPVMSTMKAVTLWSSSRYGGVFVAFLSNYSGDLILGALLSPAATGLFRASNRIVTAASDMFSQPAAMLSMTGLSARFAAGKPADGSWLSMSAGISFIGWPVLLGVALLSNQLVPVVLGPQWATAGPIVTILCLARMSSLLSTVASSLLVAYNRQHRVFVIQAGSAISVAAMTVVLVPLGVIGAALASLAVMLGSATVLCWEAHKVGRVKSEDWKAAFPVFGVPMVTTAIAALVGRSAAPLMVAGDVKQLAISIACCALGWGLGVLIVRIHALRALHVLTSADHKTLPDIVTVDMESPIV
jgi:O-antigen/teichoic acid export membrane protein